MYIQMTQKVHVEISTQSYDDTAIQLLKEFSINASEGPFSETE